MEYLSFHQIIYPSLSKQKKIQCAPLNEWVDITSLAVLKASSKSLHQKWVFSLSYSQSVVPHKLIVQLIDVFTLSCLFCGQIFWVWLMALQMLTLHHMLKRIVWYCVFIFFFVSYIYFRNYGCQYKTCPKFQIMKLEYVQIILVL